MTFPQMAPPALSATPQFTPDYWSKVPRDMNRATLVRMTKLDEGYLEFVFKNGNAFQRDLTSLDGTVMEKLHVNMDVFIQTIKGEMVTGLFVPEVGWAFKMSDDDLADYAKRLTTAMNEQRNKTKNELTAFISDALKTGIIAQSEVDQVDETYIQVLGPLDVDQLADFVIRALENAKR